jgi:hypothetical protein
MRSLAFPCGLLRQLDIPNDVCRLPVMGSVVEVVGASIVTRGKPN